MKRNFISILTVLLCGTAISSNGQVATTHKIPTAAQVAVQKKAVNRKGVMRGTTNSDRWKAATKHADNRAARIRAERKGAK